MALHNLLFFIKYEKKNKHNQQIPHICVSFHTQQQCCWKTAADYFDFQLKQSLKKWSAV